MHRLVPSRFDPPVLRGVAHTPAELDALLDLDNFTNDRVRAELGAPLDGLITLSARETLIHAAYAAFINAAFAHPGEGARFHDRTYGCWYAADRVGTAYAEVAHHRVKVWLAEGITDELAEYTDYTCGVRDPITDAELDPAYQAALAADPDDYTCSQEMARRLRHAHVRGLTYLSVRRPGHRNVALLFPEAVEHVLLDQRYVIEWQGEQVGIRKA